MFRDDGRVPSTRMKEDCNAVFCFSPGVMYNKCKQRTEEGGCSSEASQRWQLLTSRICQYLLRLQELFEGGLNAEEAAFIHANNCLKR